MANNNTMQIVHHIQLPNECAWIAGKARVGWFSLGGAGRFIFRPGGDSTNPQKNAVSFVGSLGSHDTQIMREMNGLR